MIEQMEHAITIILSLESEKGRCACVRKIIAFTEEDAELMAGLATEEMVKEVIAERKKG